MRVHFQHGSSAVSLSLGTLLRLCKWLCGIILSAEVIHQSGKWRTLDHRCLPICGHRPGFHCADHPKVAGFSSDVSSTVCSASAFSGYPSDYKCRLWSQAVWVKILLLCSRTAALGKLLKSLNLDILLKMGHVMIAHLAWGLVGIENEF